MVDKELKYVYDARRKKCVVNERHCCYYSPTKLLGGVRLSSSDNRIVSVDGSIITCERQGTATVTIHYESLDTDDVFLDVVVYGDKLPNRNKTWGSVVLPVFTVVDIGEVLKHGVCPNCMSCIWDNREFKRYDYLQSSNLIDSLFEYNNRLEEYHKVLADYMDGEICYHPDFDKYYTIRISKDDNGRSVVMTSVANDFGGVVKASIRRLEVELRDFKLRNNID